MNLIEDLITGISKKLEVFKVEVYVDEIKTKLKTPSFLIQLIDHTHVRQPSSRFKKEFPIEIVYFPDTRRNKDVNFEIYNIISELNYLMEIIELGNGKLIRGMNMSHMVESNILHFYVTYNAMVRLVEDEYLMEKLIQKNGVED